VRGSFCGRLGMCGPPVNAQAARQKWPRILTYLPRPSEKCSSVDSYNLSTDIDSNRSPGKSPDRRVVRLAVPASGRKVMHTREHEDLLESEPAIEL
jgi:hypothetical protein